MNLMDELKLMIYESNLSEDEMNLCLEAVEECETEDEFFETANDVLCLMEGNAYNKLATKYQDKERYYSDKAYMFRKLGRDDLNDRELDKDV